MLKYSACVACSFCLLSLCPDRLMAQNPKDPNEEPQLTATILHRDSLFWQAYNACDVDATRNFFTDDIEFYHDKGGITDGIDAMTAALRKGICGYDTVHVRREAIAGTVQVFPMRKSGVIYGAILSGDHRFYVKMGGKPEYLDGQAKFTHLWLLKDGVWKMSRALSYDHGAPHYVNMRMETSVPDKILQSYAGAYKGPQNPNVLIAVDSGHLTLTLGSNKFVLYAETRDRFFMRERDLTFTFTRASSPGSSPASAPGSGVSQKMIVRENGNVTEELIRQ